MCAPSVGDPPQCESCRRLQQERYHSEVCTTLFFRVVRELILILVDKVSSWNFYKYAGVAKLAVRSGLKIQW